MKARIGLSLLRVNIGLTLVQSGRKSFVIKIEISREKRVKCASSLSTQRFDCLAVFYLSHCFKFCTEQWVVAAFVKAVV